MKAWWRHQMETFSALLAICAGNPHTKASDAELWCFFFICVWINDWVNNREAGDLRRHHCHYDVMVMGKPASIVDVYMLNVHTVYPKKYAHGFVALCFVVVMQSFIMNSHEVFIHIHQGYFAGTGAIVRLPQCQWSKPDEYGKSSQYITTTKHSKAKPCAYFLGYTVLAIVAGPVCRGC